MRRTKAETVSQMKAEELLEAFTNYRLGLEDHYEADHAEMFDIIRSEIIRRMNGSK